MTTGEFCVVCGRTGRALTDGVCAECATERTTLLTAPEQVEVVLCPTCGARWSKGKWGRAGSPTVVTSEDLQPFLEVHPEVGVRTIRWEERAKSSTLRELAGEAHVRFRGTERVVPVSIRVRVIARTCTDCGRRSGGYYTAIVQLRGVVAPRTRRPKELRRRLDAVWEELVRESRPDWRNAVGWREELPEGWNVFFTDTLAARAVARLAKQRFGVKIVESASLFGRKNGQDIYRVTFCLRFPDGALDAAEPGGPAPGPDAVER